MLNRWCNEISCINLAFSTLRRLIQQIKIKKTSRGRKPKREIANYALLIALKEFDKRNLREAEAHLSRLVCKERVDHSVIAYWENKPEMAFLVQRLISIAGAMLQKELSSLFAFVDATQFTSWTIDEINVTVCNLIANQTVYPIGISFKKGSVALPVDDAVPEGNGKLYADAGYDDNNAIGVMFKKGYTPIVCPNKNRWRGHWRKKARKFYRMPVYRRAYRHRGRGESMFGSLTNEFGDRFNARKEEAMQTRILARIVSYQVKLLVRCSDKIISIDVLIIRHAPWLLSQVASLTFE